MVQLLRSYIVDRCSEIKEIEADILSREVKESRVEELRVYEDIHSHSPLLATCY